MICYQQAYHQIILFKYGVQKLFNCQKNIIKVKEANYNKFSFSLMKIHLQQDIKNRFIFCIQRKAALKKILIRIIQKSKPTKKKCLKITRKNKFFKEIENKPVQKKFFQIIQKMKLFKMAHHQSLFLKLPYLMINQCSLLLSLIQLKFMICLLKKKIRNTLKLYSSILIK